jgi:hypothetical protein
MKRLILLLTILYPIYSPAQDESYRPFIEEGKVWVSYSSNIIHTNCTRYDYIQGDTIVNGKTCKRWIQLFRNRDSGIESSYTIAAYEEDKRVYFFHNEDTKPRLLFDFNSCVGDTLYVTLASASIWNHYDESYCEQQFNDTIIIYEDSTQLLNDCYYRILRGCSFHTFMWIETPPIIEGTGSLCAPDWNIATIHHLCGATTLGYCGVNDEVLYFNPKVFESFNIPLPTSITAPRSDTSSENRSSSSANWTDLSGRQLSSPPTRKGVYIKDGRKVLVK